LGHRQCAYTDTFGLLEEAAVPDKGRNAPSAGLPQPALRFTAAGLNAIGSRANRSVR
jgi:hypothetical protein